MTEHDPETASAAADGVPPELVQFMFDLAAEAAEAAEAHAGERPITLQIDRYTALTMIGALQLATRHPDMLGQQRTLLRALVDQMAPAFAGTPIEEIIRMGGHPEFDGEVGP